MSATHSKKFIVLLIGCAIALLAAAMPALAMIPKGTVAAIAPAAPIKQPHVVNAQPPVPDHGGEVEFTGKIDSLTGTLPNLTMLIASHTVKTDNQTLITGILAVGKMVQVKGTSQPDGSILAAIMKIEDVLGDEGEVEFRSPIVSLPSDPNLNGDWVVGNFTVTVNVTTTVLPTRTAAVVGAIAEVKAMHQTDGSLLASRIKIEDASVFENEVEFKGTISNLTGTGPYTMTVANHTVKTDAQTQISGTLANGALVEVRGLLQTDGSVLASFIKVEDQAGPVEVKFIAHISGSLPTNLIGTWSFDNGQSVTVTTSTLIDQSRGAVAIGALVEVKAFRQPDNSLLAIRIKVED